jgi:hypothetical protein
MMMKGCGISESFEGGLSGMDMYTYTFLQNPCVEIYRLDDISLRIVGEGIFLCLAGFCCCQVPCIVKDKGGC